MRRVESTSPVCGTTVKTEERESVRCSLNSRLGQPRYEFCIDLILVKDGKGIDYGEIGRRRERNKYVIVVLPQRRRRKERW